MQRYERSSRRDDEDDEERTRPKRRRVDGGWVPSEWLKWLTPIVILVVSFGYNSLRTDINNVRSDVKDQHDRLPLDYIPRAELERNSAEELKVTAERNARISRIEDKVDRILQNQMGSGALRRNEAY